ncbi:recombinase family protein [Acetobacterium sp. K1/6]|uniref:recombinase family protein n=1 Tax=Acetobacterium sp. K1/6 TaxID=3055467 RepID=UPI002ACA3B7F|nr:recombinase family protein [Acetobacterium sp. K1/6]MDZ5723423.1 recombinase family protein [Acetobacterium sp. K1/6]
MEKTITQKPRMIFRLDPSAKSNEAVEACADVAEKKLHVAAYCRVSSGSNEQATSYAAQVDYYSRLLQENEDYIFSGIYADEGISGTSLKKREAFNQMMADAREHKFEMIITKSVSRFGRNTLDCLNCIRELSELGIDVYFEKENIHTIKSEGEVLLTLILAVAQNESQTQSDNVKWGIHKQYERGNIKSIPSGKFLGYDKDDEGNLVINQEQAVIVRRIYEEFLDGYGGYQIAKRLTDEKVPMAYGGKGWCPSHIKKVLINEKYKGDTQFQKTYNTCCLTKKRAKNQGELPKPYVEDTHPAIIEKPIWDLVQLEFMRQKQYCKDHHITNGRYHNQSDRFPFAGRIICETCGSTYMQLTDNEGKKYWRCKTFQGKKGTLIEGKMYNPPPRKLWADRSKNIYWLSDQSPREMYCTDVKVKAEFIETLFINAWNHLVDHPEEIKLSGDALKDYRAGELKRLLLEYGNIDEIKPELVKQTLDHICVDKNGEAVVIFLCWVRI